jgi:TolC family type I secretion outer membrane protein
MALAIVAGLGSSAAAVAADASDPFSVHTLTSASQAGSNAMGEAMSPCAQDSQAQAPLSLWDILDRALCNNPQTRSAWANAKVSAAQVGVARSAYLPTLSASGSAARNRADGGSRVGGALLSGATVYNAESAGLAAGYLLYDFGARDANLDNALQTLAAANFTQDATLQKVLLSAVQAYYQLFGARAAVEAAAEAERSSLESLKAATARYDAGTATPADRLQAQTAYSQARLNRIQAEGNAKNAEGGLASAIGMDANRPLSYAAPVLKAPEEDFDRDLDRLIDDARRRRPDLAAAEAQVKAAEANAQAARAAGMPTLSLSANANYSASSLSDPFHSQALGISLNIPIFTGFNNTYQIRAARAKVESQAAQRDSVSLQVALDVWQAYHNLSTGVQAVRSSADLVASAAASERVALGRYKAGAGTMLDLVTAQSALAAARQQNIQALYSLSIFKAALAQALGRIDPQVLSDAGPNPKTRDNESGGKQWIFEDPSSARQPCW